MGRKVCKICNKALKDEYVSLSLVTINEEGEVSQEPTGYYCCVKCVPRMKLSISGIRFNSPSDSGKELPLDDGKIMALRNAGWTYEQIADEMGCASSTIISHYRKLKGKEKKKK